MTKVLLVGGGKMGGAMLTGWLERGLARDDVKVVEPYEPSRAALAPTGVTAVESLVDVPEDFAPDVVVVAVKPQVMDDVLPSYKPLAESGAVFLSIAAGKPLSLFESHLGRAAAVVRAMPNTPAAVQRGITVVCANEPVSAAQRDLCTDLLQAVSEVHWIDDENLMDAVTAVSGSGPAYVFFLAEVMAKAGVEAGLPEELSERLARITVAGAGELLFQSEDGAATLRQNVTKIGRAHV